MGSNDPTFIQPDCNEIVMNVLCVEIEFMSLTSYIFFSRSYKIVGPHPLIKKDEFFLLKSEKSFFRS